MNQEVREFVKQSGVNVHSTADEAARRERIRRREEIVRSRMFGSPRPVINEFPAPAPAPRYAVVRERPTPRAEALAPAPRYAVVHERPTPRAEALAPVPRPVFRRRKCVMVKCTPYQLLNAARVNQAKCACLRKATLLYIAKNLGVKRTSNATKRQIYNMINKKTAPIRKRVKYRSLDDASIRKRLKRLYGAKWIRKHKPNLNADVQRVKWGMKSLREKDRFGLPFKYAVELLERRLVKRWKRNRRLR